MTAGHRHLIKKAYSDINQRSTTANEILQNALLGISEPTANIGSGPLGNKLKMVARTIAARESLGMKRQVFFVGIGGFDNHHNLLADHPPLLSEINTAMSAFYSAAEEPTSYR